MDSYKLNSKKTRYYNFIFISSLNCKCLSCFFPNKINLDKLLPNLAYLLPHTN